MQGMTTDRINEALGFVLDGVKSGTDFVLEQAPLVAREIVAWEFWSSVSASVLCLVATVVCLGSCKLIHRFGDRVTTRPTDYGNRTLTNWSHCEPLLQIVIGILYGGAVTFLLAAGAFVPTAIKATVAPRLVVIDYLSDTINGKPNRR